ncbi:FmdB family zinc ribbon protein [Agrococcus citreus]|uniref:FmdB family zinc ribbon protein n=1 Tax=Agrococcus citreus TaxID=84643 RepID=UPI0031DD44BE
MPVYAYACASCDNAFDVRQSFDEAALTVCERCGGALRKQYGTIGVSFNGPGFYRNDSRASTGPSGSKPAAKSESKAESKPKSEPKSPAKTSAATSGGSGTLA